MSPENSNSGQLVMMCCTSSVQFSGRAPFLSAIFNVARLLPEKKSRKITKKVVLGSLLVLTWAITLNGVLREAQSLFSCVASFAVWIVWNMYRFAMSATETETKICRGGGGKELDKKACAYQ